MNTGLNADEILEFFKNSNYKEIFKALVLFENPEIKEENLEKMYYDFIKNDNFKGFIDIEKFQNKDGF